MKPFVILAVYKFVSLDNFEDLRQPILDTMLSHDIKGTILLAHEGINGTFCGLEKDMEAFVTYLTNMEHFKDLIFKKSRDSFNPFQKTKVKLRKEIVTLGVKGLDATDTGVHVEPEEWNALIADPNVLVVDTRNDYEVALGTFENAINPFTENFRDFPQYVEQNLLDKKDKKIAMFCTGGIRCEKSTAYLKKLGFNEVYQLNGGILNYIEKMDKEKSKWQGECFVFDNRVALDQELASPPPGSIDIEWKNNHKRERE